MHYILAISLALFALTTSSCTSKGHNVQQLSTEEMLQDTSLRRAYFASGCFWCVEAVYESVIGIKEVISGYSGGSKETATYEQVSTGVTGHAEAVEVIYDPKETNYSTLLGVFFDSHDPTTLNRQGPDAGTQYRSIIFYQNDAEKILAQNFIASLENFGTYAKGGITTEVIPLSAFYPAEDYHQNYESINPEQPYVRSVSTPRLNKFKAKHPELLKKER